MANWGNNAFDASLGLTASQPPSASARWRFPITLLTWGGVKYISTLRQKMRSIALVSVTSDGKTSSTRFRCAKATIFLISGMIAKRPSAVRVK